MCADASNPVIVYWDISSPMPKTNQKLWSLKPELLSVSVKTNATDWWRCGTTTDITTITTTPTMCHQAEIELSWPRKLTLIRLRSSASSGSWWRSGSGTGPGSAAPIGCSRAVAGADHWAAARRNWGDGDRNGCVGAGRERGAGMAEECSGLVTPL